MKQSIEIELGEHSIQLETGSWAKQAGGSVIVAAGDTRVLVTATCSGSPREGIDFFPLTVDYREYTYAAGRFPGGYIKREGRPTEKEILTSRLIDRPIRPLFANGFTNETQVIAMDLSGVSVSAGSACSSGKVTTSHVLEAMGLEPKIANESIRISIGWATTKLDVERATGAWIALQKKTYSDVPPSGKLTK